MEPLKVGRIGLGLLLGGLNANGMAEMFESFDEFIRPCCWVEPFLAVAGTKVPVPTFRVGHDTPEHRKDAMSRRCEGEGMLIGDLRRLA